MVPRGAAQSAQMVPKKGVGGGVDPEGHNRLKVVGEALKRLRRRDDGLRGC